MKKTVNIILIFILCGRVSAGIQWRVKSVEITGNTSFKDRMLYSLMVSRPPSLFNRPEYHEKVFRDDLTVIQRFYGQKGYLNAQIRGQAVRFDSSSMKVYLTVEIEEGPLTTLEGISILGNRIVPDSVLRPLVPLKPDNPMNSGLIEKGTLALLKYYADSGYLNARVTPESRIDDELNRAIVDFIITEGAQQTVDTIKIIGNIRTRPEIIRQELTFSTGETVSYKKLMASQRNLYLSGLFESVFIQPDHPGADPSMRNIKIELREKQAIEMNSAAGYGAVDRLRGRFEIYNQNWTGRGLKIGLSLRASSIIRSAKAGFTAPRIRGTLWRMDVKGGIHRQKEPGYTVIEPGIRISLGRKLTEQIRFQCSIRSVRAKLSEIRTEAPPADSLSRIRSINYSLIYDTRDNLFNPASGFFLEGTHEMGSAFGYGFGDFHRVIFRLRGYVSAGGLVAASALEAGWMYAGDGLEAVPLQERFYTGGPSSLRGFEYQRVGPADALGTPTGGSLKLVWNIIEIRIPVWKMTGLALFCDAGNVWKNKHDFENRPLRISPGAGIRIQTPIGVARLECGINISPLPGEEKVRWMFNMGQHF